MYIKQTIVMRTRREKKQKKTLTKIVGVNLIKKKEQKDDKMTKE